MTVIDRQRQNSAGSYLATFYLVAPATGANNLVVSGLSGTETTRVFAYSYYNAKQTGQPDNHSVTAGTGNVTTSATPTVDGTLTFGGTWNQDNALSAVSGNPNHNQTASGYVFGDNGQIAPATSQSVDGQSATGSDRIISTIINIAPATAASYRVRKASSAIDNYKTRCFIGFPSASGNDGDTKNVVVGGVVTGLSGLTPLAIYYLNDTSGTYGTSPGTVTRKIGIALSTTTMLLTNEP
jgi:hypothetical protein